MNQTRIIELGAGNEDTLLVEIVHPSSNTSRTSNVGIGANKVLDKVKGTIDDTLDVIKPIGESIIRNFKGLSVCPSEASVEFGIKFSLSGSAIIASVSSEANFKVTLTWKNNI